ALAEARTAAARAAELPAAVPGDAWATARHHQLLAAASATVAVHRADDAVAAAARQRAALAEAAVRVKALERLDARRREEHAVESRRDEDREVDDVITARRGVSGERS